MRKCQSPIWSRGFIAKVSVRNIGGLNSTTLFQRSFYLYSVGVLNRSKRGTQVFWSQCTTGEDSSLYIAVLAQRILCWLKKKEEFEHVGLRFYTFPLISIRHLPKIQVQVDQECDPKPLITNGLTIDAGFCPGAFCSICHILLTRHLT